MMKRICAPLAAFAMLAMAGCATMPAYVDPALGDVDAADRIRVSEKRPVQLVFAVQTNGARNSGATNRYTIRATELVIASGLFSQVSSSPVPGGAVLSITLNNVGENSFTQALTSTMTFGLSNPTFTDFYIVTAKYAPGPTTATITAEKKHAIHSPVEASAIPEGVRPSKSFAEALDTVMRQLFEHTLNEIARDPSFQSGTAQSQDAARS